MSVTGRSYRDWKTVLCLHCSIQSGAWDELPRAPSRSRQTIDSTRRYSCYGLDSVPKLQSYCLLLMSAIGPQYVVQAPVRHGYKNSTPFFSSFLLFLLFLLLSNFVARVAPLYSFFFLFLSLLTFPLFFHTQLTLGIQSNKKAVPSHFLPRRSNYGALPLPSTTRSRASLCDSCHLTQVVGARSSIARRPVQTTLQLHSPHHHVLQSQKNAGP